MYFQRDIVAWYYSIEEMKLVVEVRARLEIWAHHVNLHTKSFLELFPSQTFKIYIKWVTVLVKVIVFCSSTELSEWIGLSEFEMLPSQYQFKVSGTDWQDVWPLETQVPCAPQSTNFCSAFL